MAAGGPSPAATPSRARRALRWGGRGLAGLLGLLVLAAVVLHTGPVKERLRRRIEARLGERVNGAVSLGRLDYLLLVGDLSAGDLTIREASGEPAITVGELRIAPRWGALLGGDLALDAVELRRVTVHVVRDADGGSNLKRLFKPRTEPLEAPDRWIHLDLLRVEDLAVDVRQPDGGRIAITDLDLAASIHVQPRERSGTVRLSELAIDAEVDGGEGRLRAGVRRFRTGLAVELERGHGTLHLDPLQADVTLRLPDRPETTFPLELGGSDLAVRDGQLVVGVDGLAAGVLGLASADVTLRRDSAGMFEGEQAADVIGLRIDRSRLHALLGREILASDVEAEIHVKGPSDALDLDVKVRSGAARIGLAGRVGLGVPTTFDAALTVDDVATEALLVPGATTVPPVVVRHLRVTARGSAASAERVTADVTASGEGIAARGVPIDRIEADARVEERNVTLRSLRVTALDQTLDASGTADLASRRVDLAASAHGDVGAALDGLRAAGREVSLRLPPGAVRIPEGGLRLAVKGPLDGDLAVEARVRDVAALGGRVSLDADAVVARTPEGAARKVEVRELGASLDLRGVRLSSIGALRGRKLPADAALDVTVKVDGPPDRATATFAVSARDVAARGVLLRDLRLGVRGQASRSQVTAHLTAAGAGGAEILAVDATVPLTTVDGRPRPALDAPFHLKASAPERSLRETITLMTGAPLLAALAPEVTTRLEADLRGTLARPEGPIALDVRGRLFPEVGSRLALRGALAAVDGRPTARIGVEAWIDAAKERTLEATLEASVARSPLRPGPRDLRWSTKVNVGPVALATLPDPPAAIERARWDRIRGVGGTIGLDVALAGDERDAGGTIALRAERVGGPGRRIPGPLDARVELALGDEATTLDVDVDAAGGRLLDVGGAIGLAGRGLITALRERRRPDPTLDLDVDVTGRPVASLAPIRPQLAGVPGTLGGHLDVGGRLSRPTVVGAIGVGGLTAAAGNPTGAGLRLDVDDGRLAAAVTAGEGGERGEGPVRARIELRRDDLAKLGTDEEPGPGAPLEVHVEAADVPLARLVPAAVSTDRGVRPAGTLASSLALRGVLRREGGGLRLAGEPSGRLDVKDGTFELPLARRTFRGVSLGLAASKDAVVLERLHAEESDVQKARRTIDVTGRVGLVGLRPHAAQASVTARDWLLFGKSLGRADAPRGSLTLDARIDGELGGARRRVDVDVTRLELLVPDRFEKAHQPEDVHVGDVFFVGEPGVVPGKLPVPESVRLRAEAAAAPPGTAAEEALHTPPTEGPGTDIHIAVRKGARVFQSPIDLSPEGAIHVALGPAGRVVRGRLDMRGGELSLGGWMHPLEKGSLVFDEAHPRGNIDLWFARPLSPPKLRDVSKASGGEGVRIHMVGPIDDRKTVISGAGTPGALYDLLAMHNAGQPRFVTQPDLPETGGVEFPQLDDVLILSFLAVNLPHLLFLDRAAAWSDPYDDTTGRYGRVDNAELERTRGALRLRGRGRPEGVGRSEAEVGVDLMFHESPTFQAGTGITAGSRLGGGPGLFLEWSSED